MADRALVAPLHTGTVGGCPVRFFRGPSGRPEPSWHAIEDCIRPLGLSRSLRRELLRMTQRHWGAELRTVATADGPVVVAPHYVAQGLLGAAVEAMGAKASVETEYALAGAEALRKLGGDLPPMARVELALAAFRNSTGGGGR